MLLVMLSMVPVLVVLNLVDDNRVLKNKFYNKRTNALKEGIGFLLSFEDFLFLLDEANITVEDLHIKGYHLSRFNDSGDYTIENCRFIPYLVNYSEKRFQINQDYHLQTI